MERPRVWMQEIRFAPELSATLRIVRIWIMASVSPRRPRGLLGRLLHDLLEHPALVPRQRPRLLDPHAVPDLAGVALVVRHEAGPAPQVLAIHRIHHQALDLHDDRLVHLVAHDHALLLLTVASIAGRLVLARLRFHHSTSLLGPDGRLLVEDGQD